MIQHEAPFMQAVIDLALMNGYLVYHTHRSDRSPAGFPDLTLARASPPDLLFVECKSERGRVTPAQREWLETLDATGVEAHLWRPSDMDAIVKRLARHARRP